MPNFYNPGNSQENFANYGEKLKNFLTDACDINIEREREKVVVGGKIRWRQKRGQVSY